MKKLFYLLYAVFFRIFRLFPVRENRVTLVSPHNASFCDSLYFVKKGFEKNGKYIFNLIDKNDLKSAPRAVVFFLKKAYLMATSSYVFLNDNFMPMSMINFSSKTTVVQLWHGQGAFKRFGLDSNLPADVRERAKKCAEKYDYITVSSENVVPIYMSAFGVEREKIIVTGIPDSDYFYQDNNCCFREKFSIPKEKKIVLYAPTFRENEDDDGTILDMFDCERFVRESGEDYKLVVRLHPQVHSSRSVDGVIDATSYDNVNDIIREADILITDYSSICMEFSMLKKPMLFYAYDLDTYAKERNFYFDYEEYVPGKVVKDMDNLIDAIKNNDFDAHKNEKFRKFNFSFDDGKSTERLINFLLGNNKK